MKLQVYICSNKEARVWLYAELIKSHISFHAKSCENGLMRLFKSLLNQTLR